MAVEKKTSDGASHDEQRSVTSLTAWIPVSLRRSTLFALSATAAVIAVVLAALKVVSNRNDGLCDARSRDRYAWTYAPVALFTIFAAAWTQVEYRAKQMQPWRSMSEGAKKASESVLLDYVSPWNVMVLYNAAKGRHGIVAMAVIGSLILQLLIVLSTGLFTLSQVEMHSSETSLIATNKFITDEAGLKLQQIDQVPAMLAVGISQNIIELPPHTTDTAAFQQVVPSNEHVRAVQAIKAEVEVLSSRMECESATVSFRRRASSLHGKTHSAWFATGFSSSSYGTCTFPGEGNGPYYSKFTPMGNTYCDGPMCAGTLKCSVNQSSILRSAPEDPILLWFAAAEMNQIMPGTLCWPKFELSEQWVTFDGLSTSTVSEQIASRNVQVPDWTNSKIYAAFRTSIEPLRLLTMYPYAINVGTSSWEWTYLEMLNPDVPITEFQNPTVAAALFKKAWQAYTTQMFNLYFRQEINATVQGVGVTNRQRLILRPVSFWLSEACLLLLFAASIALGLMKQTERISCDPSSIAGLASVLSASPELVERLQETGTASEQQLNEILSNRHFSITAADLSTTAIYLPELDSGEDRYEARRAESKSRKIHRYRPLSTGIGITCGVPLLLVALIIIFEALLHTSQVRSRLANVSESGSYEHFAWTFIPAALMVGITILIGPQHETVKVFSPYVALSKGGGSARIIVMRRPFSTFNLYRRFQHREMQILASTIAAFVGFFLTIIKSGLYTAILAPHSKQVSLQQQNWFNNNLDSPFTYSAHTPFQIEMVLNGNASYPKFTYDTLALSQVEMPTKAVNGKLEVEALPAIRADMNCTLVADGDVLSTTVTAVAKDDFSGYFDGLPIEHQMVHAQIRHLPYCRHPPQTSATIAYQNKSSSLTLYAPMKGYFGGLMPGSSLVLQETGPGSHCFGYIGVVGEVSQQKLDSLTIITCHPFAKKEFVDVTFKLPTMQIDLTDPPVVRDTSPDPINVGFGNYGEYNPLGPFQWLDSTPYHPDGLMTLDSSMRTLVYGSRGIPLPNLVGKENRDRFLNAVTRLYGLAFAQLMDGARLPTDASNSSTLTATISTPNGYRLKQSATSTHVLSCLLGIILVAFVVTTFSMRTKQVLPKNPCSIAAVASLLADSDFLGMVKPDFQHLSERQLAEELDGYTFSIGWIHFQHGLVDRWRRRHWTPKIRHRFW